MIYNYEIYKPDLKKIFLKDIVNTEKKFLCPTCDEKNENDLISVKFNKTQVSLTVCNNCGHIYYSEFLTKKFIDNYYKEEFSSSKLQEQKNIDNIHLRKGNSNKLFLIINNKLININKMKILEIGCGDGACLSYLRVKGFKHLFGNEMNKVRVENAKKIKNIKIFDGGYENIPNLKFDIIYSNHVIEHILDLNDFFNKLIKISHDKTIIIFNLPNQSFENVFNKIFFIGHIHSFNHKSILYLSKKFKFNVKFLKPIRPDELCLVISKNKEMLNSFNSDETIKFQQPKQIKSFILKPFIETDKKYIYFTIDRSVRYNYFDLKRRKDTFIKISPFFSSIMYFTLTLYNSGRFIKNKFIQRLADFIIKKLSNKKILHQGYIKLKLIDSNHKNQIILKNQSTYLDYK